LRFALIPKDNYTKFCRLFNLKSKDEIAGCIEIFLNEAKTTGYCVKTLYGSDTKFINLKLKAILQKHGITMRTSITQYSKMEQSNAKTRL